MRAPLCGHRDGPGTSESAHAATVSFLTLELAGSSSQLEQKRKGQGKRPRTIRGHTTSLGVRRGCREHGSITHQAGKHHQRRFASCALLDPSWFWKKKNFFSRHLKRLKLDTGTPEPEVEMAELYVQYERSPYFDRQSGMTLEVLGLTEPIYILSSSSRPSARLLAPLLLFPPLPRSSSSLAHLCCRSTTQPLRRRAACTWETYHTSQRKRRSMTSSTARGR